MFASDQAMAYSGQIDGGRSSAIETGTKLYISNLDYGVSNEDIKVIFLQFLLYLISRLFNCFLNSWSRYLVVFKLD